MRINITPVHWRRLSCGVILAFMLAHAGVGMTSTDNYLRGYLQALVDSRFRGLGLRVTLLEPPQVTLGARSCLGPTQKRDIERMLLQTAGITQVAWDGSIDCKTALPTVDTRIDYVIFPEHELFEPILADPRQPRFSVSFQNYVTPIQTFTAANVAIGEYFGLATGFLGNSGASQIGIQGGVFALFNLDSPSSDLINADYWIGFPISYRIGPQSYALRIYHKSSHLGDEFILGNPGIDRVNLSYEDLELLASYDWKRVRLYGGVGHIISSKTDLLPWHARAGAEYVHAAAIGTLDFIAGINIQAEEEIDWAPSTAIQAGFELRHMSQRRVRTMLEYFSGHSPNGQFFRDRLHYVGIGIYFGF